MIYATHAMGGLRKTTASILFQLNPLQVMSFLYIAALFAKKYICFFMDTARNGVVTATLARRCLQGMIHDFWGIKEKNLNAEITKLKENIPAKQWQAIDALRKIGNIGAHMEKDVELIVDVDPDEARKLLKVIELLFKNWYIADHEDNQLLDEVKAMSDEKEAARLAGRDTAGGEQLPIQ